MSNKVKTINSQYSLIKGEYIAVQDQILNKDTFTLKLARVEHAKEKQNQIIQKIDEVDDFIYNNEQQVNKIKGQYEDFEQGVFEMKFQTIKNTKNEGAILVKEVQKQLLEIKENLQHVAPILEQMKQANVQEGKVVDSFRQEFFRANEVCQEAVKLMEQEENERKKLNVQFQECSSIVDDIIKYSPWQDSEKLNLVQLVKQTRTIEVLCANQNGWADSEKRLKTLLQDQVSVVQANMQKTKSNAHNFVDSTSSKRKNEQDGLIDAIKQQAEVNGQALKEQKGRLDDFEQHALDFENVNHISDQDVLFISKEVNRYNSAIIASEALKESILSDSMQINSPHDVNGVMMTHPDDLSQLQVNLKDLQKQYNVNIDDIIKNIKTLEKFSSKSLVTRLQDDNKLAQVKVGQIKKQYEEIQSSIHQVNVKTQKVKQKYIQLQQVLESEDLEKDNEMENSIGSKIKKCEVEINGNNQNGLFIEVGQPSKNDLESQKNKVLDAVNIMVAKFNENNQKIKDAVKLQLIDKEKNDLLKINQQIQAESAQIENQISSIKEKVTKIELSLSSLENTVIKDVSSKFQAKNKLIDECDELYDQNEAIAKLIEEQLDALSKNVACTCQQVHDVSPLNTPSRTSQNNKQFINDVTHQHDQSQRLKDELSQQLDKLNKSKERLSDDIQPLNELADREIHQAEVETIYKKMQNLASEFQTFQYQIQPLNSKSKNLQKEFNSMLQSERTKKTSQTDNKLQQLDHALSEVEKAICIAKQKSDQYKDKISEGKGKEALYDQKLGQQLQILEHENIQTDYNIGDKEKQRMGKQQSYKQIQNQYQQDKDALKPYDLDMVLDQLDEQHERLKELLGGVNETIRDLEKKMKELTNMIYISRETKAMQDMIKSLNGEITEMSGDLHTNENSIQGLLNVLVTQLNEADETVVQMKNGSEPDHGADYWDFRKQIEKYGSGIDNAKNNISSMRSKVEVKQQTITGILDQRKDDDDLETIGKIVKDLKIQKDEIELLMNQGYDVRDQYQDIRKEMGDCNIPVTIKMRASEISQVREKLQRVTTEFQNLKQADKDHKHENSCKSDEEITELISTIKVKLDKLENTKNELIQYQKQKLEFYHQSDFQGVNAHIIAEIREFKERIQQMNKELKEVTNSQNDLNNKLIMQDFNNAVKLLDNKSAQLRNRLSKVNNDLKKVDHCGQLMEDNTSRIEEDDFIETLQDEMPEVLTNVNANLQALDEIDAQIKSIKNKKSVDQVTELKEQIDDVSLKIEEQETLNIKLQNEMIEWDAHKKLCRRDEELEQIDEELKDFQKDVNKESAETEAELTKNQIKLSDSHTKKLIEEYTNLIIKIENYQHDIDDVNILIKSLKDQKNQCLKSFDAELPAAVKAERKTKADKKNRAPNEQQNEKEPEDMFNMLEINCKYKDTIQDMIKNLRHINKIRTQMQESYINLKIECEKNRNLKYYKVQKDDPIDVLMGYHLNKKQVIVPVKRLNPGYYLFGTRKTIAKMNNGKLVVRLGGGYKIADEFIEEIGKSEINKIWKTTGQVPDDFDWVPNEEELVQAEQIRANSPAFARTSTALKMGKALPRLSSPAFGRQTMVQLLEENKEQIDQAPLRTPIKPYNLDGVEKAIKQKKQASAKDKASPKMSRLAAGSPKAAATSSIGKTLKRITNLK